MDHLWTPWRYTYVTDTDADVRKGVPKELGDWPDNHDCVFCNMVAAADYAIARGRSVDEVESAAGIVFRGKHNFVCLNRYPYNSGHIMVVPYEHQASFAGLSLEVAQELTLLAQCSERVLNEVYRPDGLNMGLNLGKAAGAGVAGHLHLHILPRWNGDTNFMTVVSETRVLPEDMSVTWQRLREGFRQINAQPQTPPSQPAS